jgi:hypothetical protein
MKALYFDNFLKGELNFLGLVPLLKRGEIDKCDLINLGDENPNLKM